MRVRPWLFLLAAIVAEIIGVTVMKTVADTGGLISLGFMYAMIGLSFVFLAWAVKVIPIAIAYATWETAGLVAVTVIGVRFFGEAIGAAKLSGIALLILGVVLINMSGPKAEA
ncbi:DMT family transporter [Brucella pseudogrignonensis]|uniref:DMT family transporter n=1 Tax=Brucella pseudogrignonensis TaxID=419475 RepID=UPI003D97727B